MGRPTDAPKLGRPTDCTPEAIEKAVEAAAAGVAIRRLGDHIGVKQRAVYEWFTREEEPYATFTHRVKAAAAEVERATMERLREGATGWQSAAWLLERRFGMWAGRPEDEPTKPADHSDAVDALSKLHPDLLREALRRQGG